MSPPAADLNNRTSAAVDRREWKAARRAVIVQCSRCSVKGTGQVNGRGRVASVNLRATNAGPGRWLHSCGGRLEAFDIEVGS